MKLQNVTSSVLKSIGYNKKTRTVQTELLDGSLYEYYKVPENEFDDFRKAPSLGEYYNKVIKKYQFKKMK